MNAEVSGSTFSGSRRLDRDAALALAEVNDTASLTRDAAALRDNGHPVAFSYSRKVFIPLTQLCRDVCHYCTFAHPPRKGQRAYLTRDEVLDHRARRRGAGLQGGAVHAGRQARAALRDRTAGAGRARPRHDDFLSRGNGARGVRGNGPVPACESRCADQGRYRPPAQGLDFAGTDAGERLAAPVREGWPALRLARQASGRAAGDDPHGGRASRPLHDGHPDRHRRDAARKNRIASGTAGPARALWPRAGDHHPEFPRQGGHQDGFGAGARAGRAAMDHRRRAPRFRAGNEHPGAAQPQPGRAAPADGGRHQRLGRRVAGHPRPREPGSALAASRRAGARDGVGRQASDRAPRPLSDLRTEGRRLDRRALPHACRARDRHRRLRPRRELVDRQARYTAGPFAGDRQARPRVPGDSRQRVRGRNTGRGGNYPPVPGARAGIRGGLRRRRPVAPRGQRRHGHVCRQPQHQLHQRLLFPLPVLRLLQGQAEREPARQAL